MKTRLGIFVSALLILPMAGLLLSGRDWSELGDTQTAEASALAIAAALAALLGHTLLIGHLVKIRTGNNPLTSQRNYYLATGGVSAVLGWLLAYLNLFAASWSSDQGDSLLLLLPCTLVFALLAPAVLITRAFIGSFAGVLRALASGIPVPSGRSEHPPFGLLSVAIMGLLAGAAWPTQMFWLFWASPMLLLVALQLLWHESTVFSALKSGDWGRVVCASLAGMAVGNLAVLSYQAAGGSMAINLPSPLLAQPGYALFGLMCLQLGDIIAENWRGKQRPGKKKKFPIPVVVEPFTRKKD
jgi:hypothetical protein